MERLEFWESVEDVLAENDLVMAGVMKAMGLKPREAEKPHEEEIEETS